MLELFARGHCHGAAVGAAGGAREKRSTGTAKSHKRLNIAQEQIVDHCLPVFELFVRGHCHAAWCVVGRNSSSATALLLCFQRRLHAFEKHALFLAMFLQFAHVCVGVGANWPK